MFVSQVNNIFMNPYNRTLLPNVRAGCVDRTLTSDVFIRSDSLSFKSTSAGNVLKKLKNIYCPYFGVKMISGKEIAKAEALIDKCANLKDVVKVLKKYEDNMLPVEKSMFYKFEAEANVSPDINMAECLKKWYKDAKTKLQLEEFEVLDDIDTISKSLSADTALNIRKKTIKCRNIIAEDAPDNPFKRKTLLSSINEIIPKEGEEDVLEMLKDRSLYLPTSGGSENAFIVKYASRSQQEIAKRLLRASLATIEHIKPDSLGGQNEIGNFIMVSAAANSFRSNMPLKKFIERFPDVPKNCQNYINQIIKEINKGNMKGYEAYPYMVKRTLFDQSEGLINISIEKIKYTESRANRRTQKFLGRKSARFHK